MSRITLISSMVAITLRFLLIANISADPDTTVTFVRCNSNTWATNDPYKDSVYLTIDDLVSSTPDELDYVYNTTRSYQGTTAYGYATCKQQLAPADCFLCLDEAALQINNLCTYAIGAEIELVDCSMRYENYRFV